MRSEYGSVNLNQEIPVFAPGGRNPPPSAGAGDMSKPKVDMPPPEPASEWKQVVYNKHGRRRDRMDESSDEPKTGDKRQRSVSPSPTPSIRRSSTGSSSRSRSTSRARKESRGSQDLRNLMGGQKGSEKASAHKPTHPLATPTKQPPRKPRSDPPKGLPYTQ